MGFSISQREVEEEEGHTSQLGWHHFVQGLVHGGERVHRDSRYHRGVW